MSVSVHDKKTRRIAVAAAMVAGLLFGGMITLFPASAGDEAVPPGPARGADWAVNARGETFGSVADARTPADEPDLIWVMSDEGRYGYVKKRDLDGPIPTSPKDAVQLGTQVRVIPVYETDGSTRIGSFTIGDDATQEPRP